MRKFSVLIIGICLLVGISVVTNQALAQESYTHQYIINGNGHSGTLAYSVYGRKIVGTIYGQNIEGYQVGRHVVFYRETGDNQIWTGWISEDGSLIGGNFSHRGENSYPWYGTTITTNTSVPTIESTFDVNEADADGWTVNFGTLTLAKFRLSGVYNGYIGTTAPSEGKTSYYIAPPKFHGDWRSYNRLSVDIFSSGGGYYQGDGDILLTNGHLTAKRFLPKRPPEDWDNFSIPLSDDGQWELGGGVASLNDVLGNVTGFQIRAEYGDGSDKSGLDNVKLIP